MEGVLPDSDSCSLLNRRDLQRYLLISLAAVGLLVFRLRPPEFSFSTSIHSVVSNFATTDKRQFLDALTDVLAVPNGALRLNLPETHQVRHSLCTFGTGLQVVTPSHNRAPPLI